MSSVEATNNAYLLIVVRRMAPSSENVRTMHARRHASLHAVRFVTPRLFFEREMSAFRTSPRCAGNSCRGE
jgi:hypothetical protein